MGFLQFFNDGIQEKYKVLGIFVLFSMNNGFAWLMFDPVAGWLENNVNGLNRKQLELLSSWQPAVFLLCFLFIMKWVTRYDGLRYVVRIAASAEVVGAVLKLFGSIFRKHSLGLVLLHAGQIFSGVAAPVATGVVSALSALWFEPEERTRATAAAVLFNSVGNSLCYLFVPSLTAALSFTAVVFYEIVMGVLVAYLAWFFFPQEPLKEAVIENFHLEENAAANCEGGQDEERVERESSVGQISPAREVSSLRTQLATLLKQRSCVCLLLVYAWLSGGFSAWISLFAATYHKFYTEHFIGVMSFFGMIAYVCGGLLSSYVVDLYFARQMKYVIYFCISMNSICNLIFIVSTPNDKGFCLWNLGKPFIVFSTAFCGFWNGAAAPLFYELIAEISFPVEEGVSGICVSVMENLGALVFYQVISRFFSGQSISAAYSFGMALSIAVCGGVKQRYNRSYHNYLITQNQEDLLSPQTLDTEER